MRQATTAARESAETNTETQDDAEGVKEVTDAPTVHRWDGRPYRGRRGRHLERYAQHFFIVQGLKGRESEPFMGHRIQFHREAMDRELEKFNR